MVHAGKVRAVEGWRNIIDSNNHMVLEVNQIKRIELDCIDAGACACSCVHVWEGRVLAFVRAP